MNTPQTTFPLDSTPSNAAGKVEGAEIGNNGWNPICEAPRDGTRILSFRHGFGESMSVIFWWSEWNRWQSVHGSEWVHPTHFQPLPEPPAE